MSMQQEQDSKPGSIQGDYVQCPRLKAVMSVKACTINRDGLGKLKPKETCMGCAGVGSDAAVKVNVNEVLAEGPAVRNSGRGRMPKAYHAPLDKVPKVNIGSMGAAAAFLNASLTAKSN